MGATASQLLMRIQTEIQQPVKKTWTTPTMNRRNELWVKLQGVLERHQTKELEIANRKGLNDLGKRDAVLTFAMNDTLPALAWLRRVLTDMEASDQGFRKRLYAVESPVKDDLRRELRAHEIRQSMAALDQPRRDTQFALSAETDKDEVLFAMLDAPMGPMISEDGKTRALDARAQRLHPNDYRAYQQSEILLDQVAGMRDHVVLWLRGLGVTWAALRQTLGGPLTETPEAMLPETTPEQLAGVSR